MKDVKIVFPIYKSNLDDFELRSVKRSVKILKDYTFSIICPQELTISEVENLFKGVDYEVIRFPSVYFQSIDSYNRLMLSEQFYKQYLDTKFILICQTDVFVFRDELDFWCTKNYDYIGAPWIGTPQRIHNKAFIYFGNKLKTFSGKKEKKYDHLFKVGNGGFSLRNVKKHHEIVVKNKELINYYLLNKEPENFHIEDVFFSLKVPTLDPNFAIPDWKEALNFCMDRKPELALKYNNGKLPFAVHGFNKPKVKQFWETIIKSFN